MALDPRQERSSLDRFEQHDWNDPLGLRLIAAIAGELLGDLRPNLGSFLWRRKPSVHRDFWCAHVGDLYGRVVPEIHEPGRVGVVASARSDDDDYIVDLVWGREHDRAGETRFAACCSQFERWHIACSPTELSEGCFQQQVVHEVHGL